MKKSLCLILCLLLSTQISCKKSEESRVTPNQNFDFVSPLSQLTLSAPVYNYLADCNNNGVEDFHIKHRNGWTGYSYEVNSNTLTKIDSESCREKPANVLDYGARKALNQYAYIDQFYPDWLNLFKSQLPADCFDTINEEYPPSTHQIGPRGDYYQEIATHYCGYLFFFDRIAPQTYEFRNTVQLESTRPLYEIENGKIRYNYNIDKFIDFDGDDDLDIIVSEKTEPPTDSDYYWNPYWHREVTLFLNSDGLFSTLTRSKLEIEGKPVYNRVSFHSSLTQPEYNEYSVFEDFNGDKKVDILYFFDKRLYSTGPKGSGDLSLYLR